MPQESGLYKELIRLRRGRGIQEPDLPKRLGPVLRSRSGVRASDGLSTVRQKVRGTLLTLIEGLAPDLRRAALLAFALDHEHRYAQLDERVAQLCRELHYHERTARRRVALATAAMVDAADAADPGDDVAGGSGWEMRSLRSLLRLDTPGPQLYETRTVIATRDIDELEVEFGLPRPPAGAPAPRELMVDALYGVRVRDVARRLDGDYYSLTLTLPTTLSAGAEHRFCLHYSLPVNQPIHPHYAIVPLNPCDSGAVRVRFAPDRPPGRVWLLDAVPYALLNDETPGPEPLLPDGVGEVAWTFRRLRQGHGYGVAWQPAPGTGDDQPAL